jgi:signal transduction histidine kinase
MPTYASGEGELPTGPAPISANPLRLLTSSATWLALIFLLLSFPLGVFWFTVLVTGIATGAGLVIIWVGVPILFFTAFFWTYGARAERWRVRAFLGDVIASPYRPQPEATLWRRGVAFLGDPAVWRDLVYLMLLFPLGILEFTVAVCAVSIPLGVITLPLYDWALNGGRGDNIWLGTYIAPEPLPLAAAVLLGVLLLLVAPYPVIGLVRAHAALARGLLGRTRGAELSARVENLSATRARAMEATLSDRRRLERDLHDGAQQRLTALALDLGMAKEKLASDPATAQALVEKAHAEAKVALAEIHDLARGIHPAVLTDRGLDAAISALAARCPVPVTVDVALPGRLPDVVESTAYFVVAEALTNVAKHSHASEASVRVALVADRLRIEVADDGRGGADPSRGTGIVGLADRVAALDGRLDITSPPGGPTRLVAEVPCVPS